MFILIYFNEFSGTITSLLDLYLELQCPALVIVYDLNTYLEFREYFPSIKYEFHNSFMKKEYVCDTLITSISTLKEIKISNIKYKKLVLLDSNTIATYYFNRNYSLFETIKNLHPIMLSNKFNQQILSHFDIPSFYYLHQFSEKRLSKLDVRYNSKTLAIGKKYSNKGYINIKPHWYSKLVYYRHIKIKNIFYENIGKLPFEFMYFNKPVYYSIRNKCFDDGFTEYMKKIGLDDSKNTVFRNIDISPLLYNHEIEKYL